jgi:hypothetical protein
MPVHRGVADTGQLRDVVERRIDTALGEDLLGGGQQQVVVALSTYRPHKSAKVRSRGCAG